ncbi:MAG: PrsW family intramembrane metalloprotease [Holophagaceae bacterium]|nr:PrsW family intramembrane metalloprotease [Holophagaceae bacterium]
MSPGAILRVGLGFLPVACFLAGLLGLDSFKLVRMRWVLWMVAFGLLAAGGSYGVNRGLVDAAHLDPVLLRRFVAPLVEEGLKGLPILLFLRAGRAGFLVDAAIYGFAIGTGFALVENIYYFLALPDATVALWIVRGFGTAVMHGGTTAVLAMATKAAHDRKESRAWALALPGFGAALAIHAAFNAFLLPPMWSAVAVLVVLPPLILLAFEWSEKSLRAWLGRGFDLHADLLEAIQSGGFAETRPGRYLSVFKDHFEGPMLADMLCYLRLCTELSLRAKGILMLRENGLPIPQDPELEEKIAELRYLRRSIGRTGEMALSPLLQLKDHDLWQLENLGKG